MTAETHAAQVDALVANILLAGGAGCYFDCDGDHHAYTQRLAAVPLAVLKEALPQVLRHTDLAGLWVDAWHTARAEVAWRVE